MTAKSIDEQVAILMRGVEFGDEQIHQTMEGELRQRLEEAQREGRPLRVYCGYDPPRPTCTWATPSPCASYASSRTWATR